MKFQITDAVVTTRQIRAGRTEAGPTICEELTRGTVVDIENSEWDGVHVRLETGVLWWFKPSQLRLEHLEEGL